ncbi:MAG: HlyD family efflux transporter periplasmic adaptor subunit [Thermaerobacter sp.]|nr:HlyD family efflux transporter periplasmic adaptor subunit [Thermaerobacter sp.]
MSIAQPPRRSIWRRVPMPRVALLTAGTAVLLGGTTYAVVQSAKPPVPVHYLTATVKTGSLSLTDSSTGEVVPAQQETITVPNTATVISMPVSVGQIVATGQTLATLADPSLVTQLAQDQATVLNDQNQVNLLSSSNYQASEYDAIAQAQDTLAQAEATLAADQSAGNIAASASGTLTLSISAGQAVSQGQTLASIGGTAVTAPFSGTISNVAASSGSAVSAGQPLMTETSPAQNAKILSDQAQIAGLKSQLAKLQATNGTAQQAAALAQAKAQLAQANQTLKAVQSQVNQLTITAPYPGEVVATTPAAGGGQKLLTLASTQMDVTIPIPETQISQIRVGQPVSATLPAFPGKTFAGKILSISPMGTYTNGVSTFQATAGLTAPSSVRYGMSANVSVTVETVSNRLLVPLAALHSTGSRYYVAILSGGQPHRVPVKLILQGSSQAAVTSRRLKAGANVITATLSSSNQKLKLRARGKAVHGRGKAGRKPGGGKAAGGKKP